MEYICNIVKIEITSKCLWKVSLTCIKGFEIVSGLILECVYTDLSGVCLEDDGFERSVLT